MWNKENNFNNLTYYYTNKCAPKYFLCFKDPLIIYNYIRNGRIRLHKKWIQDEFRSKLNKILKKYQNYIPKDQISTIKNIKKPYSRQKKSSLFL